MKKRLWLALSLFVIGALMLAACQPAATTEAPKPTEPPKPTSAAATEPPKPTEVPEPTFSGTVTITFVQEPDNLNPLYTTMFFSGITRDFWLKALWSFDENNQPVPELAAEIPTASNGGVSADGKTLTIKLRDDVTWSDGTPLTADDFVFTYQMIMSEKNVAQTRYPYEDYVESVEAQDAHTVVVKFKEPFAAWLTNIFSGSPAAGQGVLPKHILQPVFDQDGTLDNAAWNRAPTVGIGPFVFKEWESGSHLIFTANPKWIRPPKVEQIFVRIVPDDAAQEAAILAGDTDVGVFLSSDQIEKLEADGKVDVVAVASGYDEGWFLNVNPETAHPAMLDVNVRKAVALATDRFTIVKDLLVEEVNPVSVTFWDGTAPYGDPSLKPYPYDPEQAKQLLDQAGWTDTNGDGTRDKDGVELKLRYITNQRQLRVDMQAVVQQQWAAVGIAAELVNYSSDVYWNGYNDGGPQAQGLYDIAQYSSVGSFPDPEISNNWLCSQISSADNPDGANWQGYCNPQMDELLKKQATTLDRDERIRLYYQIEKLMYDEVIYVGIWKDPDQLSGATPFWNAGEWSVSP
ncbi:MAG: putative Extracellular solute-binding protein family 5 [Anaerolineales bacterium]|nr:putative Extracellular solute-binding protein family 5 [Anaerolineales bacterium]